MQTCFRLGVTQLHLRVTPRPRLRGDAKRIDCLVRSETPIRLAVSKRFRERCWFDSRKAAVAIIQQDRNRSSEPGGGKDKINRMVAIHIARLNPQPACGSDKANTLLPAGCSETKLNPIIRRPGAT